MFDQKLAKMLNFGFFVIIKNCKNKFIFCMLFNNKSQEIANFGLLQLINESQEIIKFCMFIFVKIEK